MFVYLACFDIVHIDKCNPECSKIVALISSLTNTYDKSFMSVVSSNQSESRMLYEIVRVSLKIYI